MTLEDLRRAVGKDAAEDVAWRLVRKRALERIAAGKFLVRPLRTLTRPTTHSAAVLAAALLQGEPYYLGGLWALTFHRLTEQQYVSRLDAFVARRHAGRRLGSARIAFHRVELPHLESGTTTAEIEGISVSISGPERTLLDLLDVRALAGSGGEALRHVKQALSKVSMRSLVEQAARTSRSSTCQRLGVLLERSGARQRDVAMLRARIGKTKSVLSMSAGAPRGGSFNKRWSVIENDV